MRTQEDKTHLALVCENMKKSYSESTAMRAIVASIPTVGAAIDIALTSSFSENRMRRLETLCEEVAARLDEVVVDMESEEFSDFVSDVFSRALSARTEEKVKRFARIFTKQLNEGKPWEEAFDASRVVSNYDDIHIEILREVMHAPSWPENGERPVHAVSLAQHGENIPLLQELLPMYSERSLELACAELVSNGLLVDEGRQRASMRLLTWFSACDLTYWLYEWVVE